MKKLTLVALAVAAFTSATVSAVDHGTSWSNGTRTVSGTSYGASTGTYNSVTNALSIAPGTLSSEVKTVNEYTQSRNRGVFGSGSTFSESSVYAGGIRMASRSESGSGWSRGYEHSNMNGTSTLVGQDISLVGNFGTGGLSTTTYDETVDYSQTSSASVTENYDFGNYSVTVGAR